MSANAKKEKTLQFKGHPLMRRDKVLYYGSMADSHIIMMQVLDTRKEHGLEVASRVQIQLQQTGQGQGRVVKSTEKNSLWSAMDLACIWLRRALSSK